MKSNIEQYLKLRNGVYYADFYHPSVSSPGNRFRKSLKTDNYEQAIRILSGVLRRFNREYENRNKVVSATTLKELHNAFLIHSHKNHRPATVESYTFNFKPIYKVLDENTNITEVKPEDIEKLKDIAKKNTTFNTWYNHISGVFNWAIKKRLLVHNPCNQVDKIKINKKTRRNIRPHEFERIIEEARNRGRDDYADTFYFMYIYSLRRGEVVRLRWEDISFEEGTIELKDSKGFVDERFPMLDITRDILKNRPSISKPFNYHPRNISKYFREMADACGIDDSVVLHSIRHAVATDLLESGVDPFFVQKFMRHKHLKTTMEYEHSTVNQKRPITEHLKSNVSDSYFKLKNKKYREKLAKERANL